MSDSVAGVVHVDDVSPTAVHRLILVVVPERGDDVGDDQVGGVLGDEFEHEDAVAPEVLLDEHDRQLPVAALAVQPVHHLHDTQNNQCTSAT